MKYKPTIKFVLLSCTMAMLTVLAATVIGPITPLVCDCQACAPEVAESATDATDCGSCCATEVAPTEIARVEKNGGKCTHCDCGDPNHHPEVAIRASKQLQETVEAPLTPSPAAYVLPVAKNEAFTWTANAPPTLWSHALRTHRLFCISLT